MAQVRSKGSAHSSQVRRVSPLKPGLSGARNWATAQMRSATYSRKGFWRLIWSVLLIFFFIILGALWLGGFLPDARKAGQNFTQDRLVSMGFVVDRIDVVGEGRLREEDVRLALDIAPGAFLFDMDIRAAQTRVESLSWVERAIVRRLWPDRIVVQIIERRPFALWQNDGVVKVVDKDGHVITDQDVAKFADLPLVVGPNASQDMIGVYAALTDYPVVGRRVDAIVQLPSGRWDLLVDEGAARIRLPLTDMTGALKRLTHLQHQKQILDREIAVIDLRLADRLTLTPRGEKPA